MLLVKELSKKIDHKQILDNITLNIPKGSIYGIIGENGAGKTTLIRHLVGAYQGDTGFVELEGMRIYENPEAKAKLVYIPDISPMNFLIPSDIIFGILKNYIKGFIQVLTRHGI